MDSPRAPRRPGARSALAILAGALASLPGCAGLGRTDPAPTDPQGALRNPALASTTRVRAVNELASLRSAGEIDQTAYRETLKRTLWARSETENVRLAAAEALLEDDAADTEKAFGLLLPTETNWAMIGFACDTSVERGWVGMTPALVRSWSRPTLEPPEDKRPERRAVTALHPGRPVEDVVFEVFALPSADRFFGEKTRREAWALLTRLDPDGSHITLLVAGAADAMGDPLMADIQASARDLRAVPLTAEQLEWIEDLRKPENAAFWGECARVIASLDKARTGALELRHAAILRWVASNRPDWLAQSREEQLSECRVALDGRKAHRRTADLPAGSGAAKESLDDWADRLSWADLLTVRVALAVVNDEPMAPGLFQQAADDLRDRSTEHGGVIDFRDGAFVALSYPPRPAQRSGDLRFVASPELLDAGATALFHYHLHVQRHDNGEYAGPGTGDLEYAARFGSACLVFTHLDRNSLGADYYQPNGARLDLGAIARP